MERRVGPGAPHHAGRRTRVDHGLGQTSAVIHPEKAPEKTGRQAGFFPGLPFFLCAITFHEGKGLLVFMPHLFLELTVFVFSDLLPPFFDHTAHSRNLPEIRSLFVQSAGPNVKRIKVGNGAGPDRVERWIQVYIIYIIRRIMFYRPELTRDSVSSQDAT